MTYGSNIELPWRKINEFLLDCGSIRAPRDFAITIMQKIPILIPYDQARLYFLNDKGTVIDEKLFGVDKRWTSSYHEYYSKIENGRYSLFAKAYKNGHYYVPKIEDSIRDWEHCEHDQFVNEYLKPQGIRYSFGFLLFDNQNSPHCMFILDRTSKTKFTAQELQATNVALAHLNNLFQNYFVDVSGLIHTENLLKLDDHLTDREVEITELLKKGFSPTNISQRLWITQNTVYKHIYHIYQKMNVSSQQELLVKLLSEESKLM